LATTKRDGAHYSLFICSFSTNAASTNDAPLPESTRISTSCWPTRPCRRIVRRRVGLASATAASSTHMSSSSELMSSGLSVLASPPGGSASSNSSKTWRGTLSGHLWVRLHFSPQVKHSPLDLRYARRDSSLSSQRGLSGLFVSSARTGNLAFSAAPLAL
jgi:hypothetical protein